jgi:hypothetical protein
MDTQSVKSLSLLPTLSFRGTGVGLTCPLATPRPPADLSKEVESLFRSSALLFSNDHHSSSPSIMLSPFLSTSSANLLTANEIPSNVYHSFRDWVGMNEKEAERAELRLLRWA